MRRAYPSIYTPRLITNSCLIRAKSGVPGLPSQAYLRESGRDPEFSCEYGRMY